MKAFPKQMTKHLLFYLFALVASFVLAACEGVGTSMSLATPTPHVPIGAMKTYSTFGYTIRYPAGWMRKEITADWVLFSDTANDYNMAIFSKPNPEGRISADEVAEHGLIALRDRQPVHLPLTIRLAGQRWSQRAAIGWFYGYSKRGLLELVSLATNPTQSSGTVTYSIIYDAPASKFDQAVKLYFTPMLQSFRFTA
jgi:hypothetical protein